VSGIVLSVLDQSPVRKGGTPAAGIRETLELAELCDRLGYHRYWLAEHHSTGSLASASPEILIGQIASRTKRIRVGSGGVMLTHYAPLKVAEQFRMLETLHPGRIDLGIGRAPGSDTRTAQALADGRGLLDVEHYPAQLMDLYGFLSGSLPPGHPYHGIAAQPAGDTVPELWLLGSTRASAQYAAELGWAFCFAHFISTEGPESVIREYEAAFQPSPFLAEPRSAIGVAVTCAETDEEAEYLSWSRWGSRVIARARGGHGVGIPSPEEAMAYDYTEPELDYIAYLRQAWIHGSPGTVRGRLEELAQTYGTNEFVVVTITYDFTARKRSYELLAAEFGLPAQS
jgi:luciferase family oxidoreductase group 1